MKISARVKIKWLSPRFEQELDYAGLIHLGQIRKGTKIHFLANVLGLVSIALEHGAKVSLEVYG